MSFLIKEELKTVASVAMIDKITAADDAIVNSIIAESISLMKGYMSKYYDVDLVFSATEAERHLSVLKRLKDIVIFEVYERLTREQNLVAKRRYDEAILWLEALNKGEMFDKTIPVPIKPEQPTSSTESESMRWGGNSRYSSKY